MRRQLGPKRILALIAGLVAAGAVALGATAGADAGDQTVSASVGSGAVGQALAPGFLGVSLEYGALHAYTGRDPAAINPVLVQLLRGLAPGAVPGLRIGGNSADYTWWPLRGLIPPVNVKYSLTPGWLRTTKALAQALHAQMIMGVNLAGGRPPVAVAEAHALLGGIGRRYIQAIEIGNEGDVYGQFPWFRDRRGRVSFARPHNYSLSQFIGEFSRWRAALGRSTPVAGPAFAELNWLSGLNRFITAEPGLKVLTIHRYPLRACLSPGQDGYPTVPALLSDKASGDMASAIASYAASTHARGLPFRLDELNSASCSGKWGVSDTFASALWMLDVLFNLQKVGVDAVNIHSLPGAAYELFTFTHTKSGWEAFVRPEYYGLLTFAQAFPPGARQLPVNVSSSGPLKVWATQAPDGHTRVTLINKDPSTPYQVQLQVPGAVAPAQLERLQAPSADASGGVTLGGQSFGAETTTGTLPSPQQSETVIPVAGSYSIRVPAASAALLTQ